MQDKNMPADDCDDLPAELTPRDGVLALYGYGIKVLVERGQLLVADGIGASRRRRRFARATHGLRRLVVTGNSGCLSLDALRWCDRLGISVIVLDPHDAHPIFTTVGRRADDARLRRVQGLMTDTQLELGLIRDLLYAKIAGQAALLRDRLLVHQAATTVQELGEALPAAMSASEARQLEAAAAACYWQAWIGHPNTAARFANRDIRRVPEHWLSFAGRRSVLASANANRRADRPVNAILNFCYALLETEAVRACFAVGLDPGLGLVHLDAPHRASMALDLIEPVRPQVESYVLDLIAQHPFMARDFVENADGHVRLLPPLTLELASTLPVWSKAIGIWAETVAHTLGQAVEGKFRAATPLTGTNLRRAQDRVRVRKARARTLLALAAAGPIAKQRPGQPADLPLTRTCLECGAITKRASHLRCPGCWAVMPGQDVESRARRGQGIAASRAELERWRQEHPGAKADPDDFRTLILPGLATVTLSEIMAALDCAKSTASLIRSGRHTPALRHWPQLAKLEMDVNQAGGTSFFASERKAGIRPIADLTRRVGPIGGQL